MSNKKSLIDQALDNTAKRTSSIENPTSSMIDRVLDKQRFDVSMAPVEVGSYGVGESKYDTNVTLGNLPYLQQQRAEAQSGWAQLGNSALKLVPNIALGIAENVGYILDLEQHYKTMTGEGGDYSNWLTELAQSGNKAMNENFPVYRSNPNATFDLSDPAWWYENGFGLAESIGEFAVTGMGVGSLLGKGAATLATAMKTSATGTKALMTGAQTMTAYELAYVEGAMGGSQVYKETYDSIIKNFNAEGIEEITDEHKENARKQAGEAAAVTVRLNSLINTGLNFTGIAPVFRKMSTVKKLEDSAFSRMPSETHTDYLTRLKSLPETSSINAALLRSTGLEMGQESLEEIVNEIATAEGLYSGKKNADLLKKGEDKSVIGRLIEVLGKDETALAAILGAVGGGGQKALLSLTPQARENKQLKNQIRQKQLEYLVNRVEGFSDAQDRLSKAAKDNDQEAYQKAQSDLFDLNVFNSFVNGAEEQLIKSYEDIGKMEPEEAAKLGFVIDPSEADYYKDLSKDKMNQIKDLSEAFEDIVHKYTENDPEAMSMGYGETLFNMYMTQYTDMQSVKKLNNEISKTKADLREKNNAMGIPSQVSDATDMYSTFKSSENLVKEFEEELAEAKKENFKKTVIKEKYKKQYGEPKRGILKNHVIKSINSKIESAKRDLEKNKEALSEAKEIFKEADIDESFTDYMERSSREKDKIIDLQKNIKKLQKNIKSASDAFDERSTKAGRDFFVKSTEKRLNKKADAVEERKEEAKDNTVKKQREVVESVTKEDYKKEISAEWSQLIDRAVNEKELNTIIEQMDKNDENTPELMDQITIKRQDLESKDIIRDLASGMPKPETEPLTTLTAEQVADLPESKELTQEEVEKIPDGDIQKILLGLSGKALSDIDKKSYMEDGEVVKTTNLIETSSDATKDQEEKEGKRKKVQAGISLAYLSKEYETTRFGLKKDITSEKQENLFRQIESNKILQAGDSVTLKVDDEFKRETDEGTTATIDSFTLPDGSFNVDEVPIGVYWNDQLIGYIHTQSWLSKKSQEGDYMNVADENGHDGNAQLQLDLNKELREQVILHGSVDTKIQEKLRGSLSRHHKNEIESVSTRLPKLDTLVIGKNNAFYKDNSTEYSDEVVVNEEYAKDKNGWVFGAVPTPVSGERMMIPMSVTTLNPDQSTTAFKLIQYYFEGISANPDVRNSHAEERKIIFKRTGNKPGDKTGIFNLINDIIYSYDVSKSIFKKESDSNAKPLVRRNININTKEGIIQFSTQGRSIKTMSTHEEFLSNAEALKSHLDKSLFSVKLSKINSNEKATVVNITENDEVDVNSILYNDHVKENLYTNLVSSPIDKNDPDSEHVYFDQPTVILGTEEVTAKEHDDLKEDLQFDLSQESFMLLPGEAEYKEDESVTDYSISEENKQLLRSSVEDLFVIDSETKQPINMFKQQEIVDTIAYEVAYRMLKGMGTEEAFEQAKQTLKDTVVKLGRVSPLNIDQVKEVLDVQEMDQVIDMIHEYEVMFRNWDQFKGFASDKVMKVFGIEVKHDVDKTNYKESEEESEEDTEDAYNILEFLERKNFDDESVFQIDPRKSLSARIKVFLSSRHAMYVNSEGKTLYRKNLLGKPKFIPFDIMFNKVQNIVADTNSIEEFTSKLQKEAGHSPELKNILIVLDASSQQMRNQFYTFMSKTYSPTHKILWSKKRNKKTNKPEYQFQVLNSNIHSTIKLITNKWTEGIRINMERIKNDRIYTNAIKIDDLLVRAGKLTSMTDGQQIEEIRNIFADVGINLNETLVRRIVTDTKDTFGSEIPNKKTFIEEFLIKRILKGLARDEEGDAITLSEAMNNIGGSLKVLARAEERIDPSSYPTSYRNALNKLFQTYTLNTYLSTVVNKLKDKNEKLISSFKKISFSSDSDWLRRTDSPRADFRKEFGISYVDAIGARHASGPKARRKQDSSDREIELMYLSFFHNTLENRNKKPENKVAYFIYPTPGDKGRSPIIRSLTREVKDTSVGAYEFGVKIEEVLLNIAMSEVKRIRKYQEKDEFDETIKGYDNGGAEKFFMFPFLNKETSPELWGSDGVLEVDQNIMLEKILEFVKTSVEDTVTKWKDLGIVTKDEVLFDAGYLNSIKRQLNIKDKKIDPELVKRGILSGKNEYTEEEINAIAITAAQDLEINYMISNANILQLMVGDPALHYKGKGPNDPNGVEKTMVEVGKRIAKDIAAGLRGNFANKKYTVAYIKDKELASKNLKEYAKTLNIKEGEDNPYDEVNATDAQELTTLSEHIDVMFAFGKLEDEVYLDLKKKARRAKAGDYIFEKKELGIILQPMKPVQVSNSFLESHDVNRINYIKSSSYPLVPQLTKGFEVDKLRRAMERDKIARVVYISAAKLGATDITDVYEGHKIKSLDTLKLNSVTLDREGFRIQQEVPYKESKKEIRTITQMNKLLFEGILDIRGMKTLKKEKEKIRMQLLEENTTALLERFGATRDAAGDITYESLGKIQKVLIEEATERNYPLTDIQALQLTPDKKSFMIPLAFHNSAEKIESLLLSLITNNVLRSKTTGNSYVQGVSSGFESSKEWSEMTDKDLGSIIFTENADMTDGLKFIRKEGGKVKAAQVLVPHYFLKNGKKVDIKKYTKEVDGKTLIDTEKIDPELLNMIGARIPNQGHSSMLPLEVVGFLPDNMGNLIIVPDDITTQMGADFDVDKLFVYQYSYDVTEDGIRKKGVKPKDPVDENITAKFKSSLFRGQEEKPHIDSEGNLVMVPTYDTLFKSEGISFGEDLDLAEEYGSRYSKNPYIIEINKDYLDTVIPLDKTGGTQTKGKRVIGDEREQRIVSEENIVIPSKAFAIHKKNITEDFSKLSPKELVKEWNKKFVEDDVAEHLRYGEVGQGYATESIEHWNQLQNEFISRGLSKTDVKFLQEPSAIFSIEEIVAEVLGKTKEYKDDNVKGGIVRFPDTEAVTKKDIETYLKHQKEVIDSINEKTDSSKIINRYIEIHWEVLTHPEVYKRIIEPLDQSGPLSIEGETKFLSKIGVQLASLKPYLLRSRQVDDYISNRSGKFGVARLSNASVFNSTIQDKDLFYGESDGKAKVPKYIRMIKEDGRPIKLYKLSGKGTGPVSKALVISDMQSAAVDNAKNQTLSKINLNDNTFNAANALAQLSDENDINLDVRYITRLLTQEVVQRYVSEIQSGKDSFSEGRETFDQQKTRVIAKLRDEYMLLSGEAFDETPISFSEMEKALKDQGEGIDFDSKYFMTQVKAINLFEELDALGSDMSSIQSTINVDSRGPGKDLFDVVKKASKVKAIHTYPTIMNASQILTGETGAVTRTGVTLPAKMFSGFFPYFSKTMEDITSGIADSIGLENVSSDMRRNIWNAMRSYSVASKDIFDVDVDAKYKELLLSENNIAVRVLQAQSGWGKDNVFINAILPVAAKDKNDAFRIEFYSAKGESSDENRFMKAFTEMLVSDNEVEQELAKDLVIYTFLTSGRRNPNSFINHIPPLYLDIIGYGKQLNNIEWNNPQTTENFVDQFMRHNPYLAPEVPQQELTKGTPSQFTLPFAVELSSASDEIKNLTIAGEDGRPRFPDYLKTFDLKEGKQRLYKQKAKSPDGVEFYEVDTFGFDGTISEYNPDISKYYSAFPKNKSNYKPKIEPKIPDSVPSETIRNPIGYYERLENYGIKKTDNDINSVKSALEHIKEVSEYKPYKALAEILLANIDKIKGIKVETVAVDPSTGKFENDTLYLNVTKLRDVSTLKFEEIILHELVHAFTKNLILDYKSKRDSLTREQQGIVEGVGALRRNMISALDKDELKNFMITKKKYKDFATAIKKGRSDITFTKKELETYYPLINDDEFVTGMLTNEAFQKRASRVEFKGPKKNVINRFIELISRYLNTLVKALGLNIRNGDFLYEAVAASTNLLTSEGGRRIVDPVERQRDSAPNQDNLVMNIDLIKKFRKEFNLLDEKGVPTKMEWKEASDKANELNQNYNFIKAYGDNYKAIVIDILGEDGDIVNTVGLESKDSGAYAFTATEDVESVDEILTVIERLENTIVGLKKAIGKDPTKKVVYESRINKMEEQIDSLRETRSRESLETIAMNQLDWVAGVLSSPKVTINELFQAGNVISVWEDMKEFKETQDEKDPSPHSITLDAIASRANDLSIKWRDMLRDVMLTEVNKDSTFDIKKEDLTRITEMSAREAYTLDLSNSASEIILALDKWLKNSARDTNYEFNDFMLELKERFDKFKDTAEHKKNKFDTFLQKGEDGKYTGNLVHEYSVAWFKKLTMWTKDMSEAKNDVTGWNKFRKRLLDNTEIIRPDKLFTEEGRLRKPEETEAYITSLTKKFGKEKIQDVIRETKQIYNNFLNDMKTFEDELDNRVEFEEAFTEREKAKEMMNWRAKNDPVKFVELLYDKVAKDIDVKRNQVRGYNYTVVLPNRTKDSKWYDKNYEKIQNEETLKEFYDYYTETLNTLMSMLPKYAVEKLKSNFLPFIRKSTMEILVQDGMKGAMTNLRSDFVNSLTVEEIDEFENIEIDPQTGRPRKNVPVRFISQPGEETSRDMVKVLQGFASMAINYKHKSKVEDKVLLMQRLINEANEAQLNAKNDNIIERNGKLLEFRNGNLNVKKAVEYAINGMIYGEKKKDQGVSQKKIRSKEERAELKVLKDKVKDIEGRFKRGNITEDTYNFESAAVQSDIDKVGGKNIVLSKMGDKLIQYTQLKGLGYNVFSAVANLGFGFLGNATWAAGREDFTTKTMGKAFRLMLATSFKSFTSVDVSTSKKIRALMERYDILFEVNEALYGKDRIRRSKLSRVGPMELQKRSEYFVQGMTFVAMMLHKKVTDVNGKERTLFEAYDENGNWKTEEFGEQSEWDGDINKEGEMTDYRNFRNNVIETNKKIHGNYDPSSIIPLKQGVMGRFLMQFRSWIPEGIETRFGKEKPSAMLGRTVKGRYITVKDLGFMKSLKIMLDMLMRKPKIEGISPVDEANLRKNLAELLMWVGLTGLILMMKGVKDDDDDEFMNATINMLGRIESDITFYLSPATFKQILKDPLPVFKTVMDFTRAANSVFKYANDDKTSDETTLSIMRAFPYLNQYTKIEQQTKKVH